MKHIAIIGSGPAGCYLAEHLLRLLPDVSIDVLEKLPVPFGLIRYGVAPDHQSTKGVARVLDRVLGRDRVSFFGNVEVGRDVRLAELRELYNIVVLATGAAGDRRLGIPGEDLPGVIGSGPFVGWYNGHPQHRGPTMGDVQSTVIIGNGNVALDVARVLAKGAEELAGSDVSPEVMAWLSAQPLRDIHIVGRRAAAEAKFNHHELAELGTLQKAKPSLRNANLPGDSAVITTLRSFAQGSERDAPVTIHFHFNLAPRAFLGSEQLRAVQFRTPDGEALELPAQLAVTCIGYETLPCCSASPTDGVFANQDGKVEERLYVVGWAKRGPSGTIPTNRAEAQQVAAKIAQELTDEQREGAGGLRKLLERRHVSWVDYAGWRRIDAAETVRAGDGRCREKFCNANQMLEAAHASQFRPA